MFESRATARSLVVPFVVAVLAACGGGDGGDTGGQVDMPEQQAAAPAAVPDAATLNGTITFTGTPPAPTPIDMSEEPACDAKHPGGATSQEVVTNNGMLANVFVYVKEGITGNYPAPSNNVLIDQNGCVYVPHVSGVQPGQGLVFRNSDGIAHNYNATPTQNRGFNKSQPTSMDSPPERFTTPEIMIPVRCDVHGWMQAYVGAVSHPYFAVSAEDGSFTIPNLPPGTYTLEAWHEKYGVQTQQITVGANEMMDVTFGYSASMAGAVVPMGKPIDPHGSHVVGAHQH